MCFASGRRRPCAGHCQELTLDLWVHRALVVLSLAFIARL
jgi:hypothetical protein